MTNVDGGFLFVTSQDPNVDASLLEVSQGLNHSILKVILHSCGADHIEVTFNHGVDLLDLPLLCVSNVAVIGMLESLGPLDILLLVQFPLTDEQGTKTLFGVPQERL